MLHCLGWSGHVHPLLAVARALQARGHDVALMTGSAQAPAVVAAGVPYLPPERAPDRDFNRLDATFPELRGLPNPEVLARLFWELAVRDAPAQAYDLALAAARRQADVLVNDGVALGVPLAASVLRRPWATVSPFLFCTLPDPALPPPFLGLASGHGPLDRLAAETAERLLELRLAVATQRWRALAAAWKLPSPPAALRVAGSSPWLYLYPGGTALEYPRRQPRSQVHAVGPLVHEHGDPPLAPAPTLPRLFLTEGTTHTDLRLAQLAMRVLAGEPVELLMALPSPDAERRLAPLPPNARVVGYVSYRAALDGAAALVTNGGAGSLLAALAAGVPALILPGGLDKAEAAQRLAAAGAGLRLPDAAHCSLRRFRHGVRTLLTDPAYRRRAQAIGRHLVDLGGAERAADLLAGLARGG